MASQPPSLSDVIHTEQLDRLLNSPIHKLLRAIDDSGKYVDVEREHMEVVCSSVLTDLLKIFNRIGLHSELKHLCLGDYADRGPQSVEITTLLLAYKLRYPHNIYLLRDNHECARMCKTHGFEREITQRYNDPNALNNVMCFQPHAYWSDYRAGAMLNTWRHFRGCPGTRCSRTSDSNQRNT
ncbi:Serine/threonine-protein phosphatase beta isoform [Taenia solium]|eukprot:TsM_000248200 transcript=TsM_000248200 gene=TsM_000248200